MSGRRSRAGIRGVSACAYCGGSNDFRSSICTRPACLARYWRMMAERAQYSARDYLKRAESLEAEARAEESNRVAAGLAPAPMAASIGQQIENGVMPREAANQ